MSLFTSIGLAKRYLCKGVQASLGSCSSDAGFHSTAALSDFPLLYPNHKMAKDVRIRQTVKKYNFERQNLIAIKRAKFLPAEIRDDVAARIDAMPLNSRWQRMHGRCLVTSRPRGRVPEWKLSRIVWRLQADYNKLSGIQRAMWWTSARRLRPCLLPMLLTHSVPHDSNCLNNCCFLGAMNIFWAKGCWSWSIVVSRCERSSSFHP